MAFMKALSAVSALLILGVAGALALQAQRGGGGATLEPFVGVTTGGAVTPDLFSIRATGVSTQPVVDAAGRFLAALTPAQRTRTTFEVDDSEWRRWNNVHRAARAGVAFREMSGEQQARAYDLLKAVSARRVSKRRGT